METIETTNMTRRALVRCDYSQDAVWRPALGESAALYVFVTFECGIDAPDYSPAGSMKSSQHGAFQSSIFRE
jgi:hypothetical protein